jgi:uncharacterized membrane protein
VKALQVAIAVGYPFLVFALLQVMEPRGVALCVAGLLVLRWVSRWQAPTRGSLRRLLAPVALVGAVIVGAASTNEAWALFMLPVAINAALLLAFGASLVQGPPLVETFARLQVHALPPDEVRYCRTVTAVWCLFFVANGAVCAWLAWRGPAWLWALHTGFLAYLGMGLLFAVEFVVRSWRFGRYAGTPVEPLFRRIFRPPPEDGAPAARVDTVPHFE